MKRLAIALLSSAALAACGSSTTSGGTASSPSAEATSSTSTTSTAAIAIATGSVTGLGTVLVDANGHTLYRFTPEASGQIVCTTQCAANWPPVVVPPGESVNGDASLTGRFATIARPDGTTQATYNGWPLYAFGGDTAAGQANGQGKLGKWFAVTPNVPSPTGAASPTM